MNDQRETLIAKLRELGVTYLAPSDAVATEEIASVERLIKLLIASDSRLQLALIPLFIRHPEFASSLPSLLTQLDLSTALDLQTLYTAAVYMQRRWKTRLSFYLDTSLMLPDLFSEQLGLPPADEYFGKTGLYELAEAWKARSRYPFDRLAALHRTIDLFFEQLKLEAPLKHHAPAS